MKYPKWIKRRLKENGMSDERNKAIEILETIAEMLGNEDMFDCIENDKVEYDRWYRFEDAIVEILKS